ncbi:MAG: hypothetical protein ACXACC_06340 [Promethearchaeota archaeon]|jgi:hypothetical protein
MIVLFTVYAGCTFYMVTMNLIPPDMLLVEILDFSILIVVVYVVLDRISKVKNKSESSISE